MRKTVCDVCSKPMNGNDLTLDICSLPCLIENFCTELPAQGMMITEGGTEVIFTPRLNHKTLRALEQLRDVIWDLLNGNEWQKCCAECRFWRSNHGGSAMRCRKTGIEGPFDNGYINDCPYFEGYNTTP